MIAIYTRQSVDRKDSISIEAQIEFCKKEITEDKEFKVYTDKGFSGKDTNRPAFEKLLKDIKSKYIERVIVYRLDRISRSILDFANIIDIFKKHNVEFTSSTERFDTSSNIGSAMLFIIMIFAQLERETIQQRITDNYYIRGNKGFFLGGRIPYGFYKEKIVLDGKNTSMLKPNAEIISNVEKMYELYAKTNMSLGEISRYFNELNIPSASNKNWDSGKISRMLKSPLYVKADADIYSYYKNNGAIISNELNDFVGINGCYLFGKRKPNERKYTNVENHILVIAPHEGIVDSKTWLLCQYKLDRNKQVKNTGKGKHSWLSGLICCDFCGYSMSAYLSNGGKYRYFRCKGKDNMGVCVDGRKMVKIDEIEGVVKQKLFDKILETKNSSSNNIVKQEDSFASNKLKIELIEIESKIENMINQMAEGNEIVMKYVNNKIVKLDQRKSEIIEEIKNTTLNENKTIDSEELFNKINQWDELSLEEKKEICSIYINKIQISNDTVEINWKV